MSLPTLINCLWRAENALGDAVGWAEDDWSDRTEEISSLYHRIAALRDEAETALNNQPGRTA